jgi:hypothetical protein
VGEDCFYLDRDANLVPAKIVRIDMSILPFGYEIYMIRPLSLL